MSQHKALGLNCCSVDVNLNSAGSGVDSPQHASLYTHSDVALQNKQVGTRQANSLRILWPASCSTHPGDGGTFSLYAHSFDFPALIYFQGPVSF